MRATELGDLADNQAEFRRLDVAITADRMELAEIVAKIDTGAQARTAGNHLIRESVPA